MEKPDLKEFLATLGLDALDADAAREIGGGCSVCDYVRDIIYPVDPPPCM